MRKPASLSALLICVVVLLTGCTDAFKTEDLVSVLKEHGDSKFSSLESYNARWGTGSGSGTDLMPYTSSNTNSDGSMKEPTYYVSKDPEEADLLYKIEFDDREKSGIFLEEMVVAHSGDNNALCLAVAKQEYSAQDIYDNCEAAIKEEYAYLTENNTNASISSGSKNGYTYTLLHYKSGDDINMGGGLYIKGNAVIMISSDNGDDYFFKKLGLVSPFDLN